jgi:hypothetical protein
MLRRYCLSFICGGLRGNDDLPSGRPVAMSNSEDDNHIKAAPSSAEEVAISIIKEHRCSLLSEVTSKAVKDNDQLEVDLIELQSVATKESNGSTLVTSRAGMLVVHMYSTYVFIVRKCLTIN